MYGEYVCECNRTLKGFNNDIMEFTCCVLNPYRGFVCVGIVYSTSFTRGYSYSIPSGLYKNSIFINIK